MNNIDLSKEAVYKSLQNPSREDLINIIFKGFGEQNNLDFKENWSKDQKIAQIILGMANIGGGLIIVGVKEKDNGTLEANGLREIEDKEKLHSKFSNFIPDNVKCEILDYDFTTESYDKIKGKMFQILVVDSDNKELPYVWKKNTDNAEEGCIFFRRGTKTVKANMQEIKEMINKRIQAVYGEQSSLELQDHLKQLKVLYKYRRYNSSFIYNDIMKNRNIFGTTISTEDKKFIDPDESYEEFVANMILKKKKKIERVLELN